LGARRGIGRASAIGFEKAGAAFVVSNVNAKNDEETVTLIEAASAKAIFQQCHASKGSDAS